MLCLWFWEAYGSPRSTSFNNDGLHDQVSSVRIILMGGKKFGNDGLSRRAVIHVISQCVPCPIFSEEWYRILEKTFQHELALTTTVSMLVL